MLNSTQRQILRAAISDDPSLQELANRSADAELLTRLTTPAVPGRVLVLTYDVKRHALEQGYYAAIVLASRSHPSIQVMSAAISAVGFLDDVRFTKLDFDLPAVVELLGGLVAGQIMTQAQVASLDAMADGQVSIAERELGRGAALSADDIPFLR